MIRCRNCAYEIYQDDDGIWLHVNGSIRHCDNYFEISLDPKVAEPKEQVIPKRKKGKVHVYS